MDAGPLDYSYQPEEPADRESAVPSGEADQTGSEGVSEAEGPVAEPAVERKVVVPRRSLRERRPPVWMADYVAEPFDAAS